MKLGSVATATASDSEGHSNSYTNELNSATNLVPRLHP